MDFSLTLRDGSKVDGDVLQSLEGMSGGDSRLENESAAEAALADKLMRGHVEGMRGLVDTA